MYETFKLLEHQNGSREATEASNGGRPVEVTGAGKCGSPGGVSGAGNRDSSRTGEAVGACNSGNPAEVAGAGNLRIRGTLNMGGDPVTIWKCGQKGLL